MMRCHEGSTTIEPSARRGSTSTTADRFARPTTDLDALEIVECWAVKCASCGRTLALVEGTRDEVYADL